MNKTSSNHTAIAVTEYRVYLTNSHSIVVSPGEYGQLVSKNIIEAKSDKLVNIPKSHLVRRLVSGKLLKAYINRCSVDFRAFTDNNGQIVIYKLAVYVMDYLENYVSTYVARALASFLGKMIRNKALYN